MELSNQIKGIVTLLIVILLAALINPSSEKHKEKVNRQCRNLNPVTGTLGGCNLYSELGLKYHNGILFSYTDENNGKGETVSVGVMGFVFITKDLDI